ncbi:hypothetical protein [Pseudomonas sp. Irchel s3b5]|uniref:hypothetical protein n=1 Tax=Pseudomonas sp. Irchel s3b5 TaxID=2009077 RepID=UPI000BA3C693|nr:hypothetical protein [Pseudomonas sp. Irchel s3b5]
MSKLEWDHDRLLTLGLLRLRSMCEKMREGSLLKLGTTGTGLKPHYQVTHPKCKPIAFNGLSHKRFDGAEVFDEDNLSRPFTYVEITAAYEGTRQPKKS